MMRVPILVAVSALATLALDPRQASASVVVYDNYDVWTATAGPVSTVTFTEVPAGTFLTNQYQHLGIQFTSADPDITGSLPNQLDNGSVNGLAIVEITFAQSINAFSWHHPGFTRIKLFSGDSLVYQSGYLGGSGYSFFSGVQSTISFNRIQLNDPGSILDDVFIDNIYFSTIPGPAGLMLFGLASALGGGRGRMRR